MKARYDFSGGTRGKFDDRIPPDANFVRFDPRVSALFVAKCDFATQLLAVALASKGRTFVGSVALSPKEYAALRPLLEQLGGTVFGEPKVKRRRNVG